MLIRIPHSSLNRSINIIMDHSYNENTTGLPVISYPDVFATGNANKNMKFALKLI